MYQTTQTRVGSSDGVTSLYCTVAIPQGPIRGVVQVCHGMQEHIGRYRRFFGFLAEQGFVVCGHDHIGHGRSCPDPELFGFFGESEGYRHLVEDVFRVNQMIREQFPQGHNGQPLRCFLFGHSMGSLIARLFLSKHSDAIDGAILCGTAGPNPASKAGLTACDLAISSRGARFRPSFLEKLIFGQYNARYPKPKTDKDWLSRDELVVEAFLQDPLCRFRFTAAGYRDLLCLQYYSNTRAWYRTLDTSLPVLLIAGEMDPVGNFGKGVTQVYHRMQRAGLLDVSCRLYPQARHELLNEINYGAVQEDILHWLEEHLAENGALDPSPNP